jgi:hypothetical protein
MNERKFLEKLYKSVPTFTCVEGCSDCCGPVFTTKTEAEKLGIEVGTLTNKPGEEKCRFAGERGCSVHNDRPLMCRLYGATDIEELVCPHGRKPGKPLKKVQTTELIGKYKAFVILDANKVQSQIKGQVHAS